MQAVIWISDYLALSFHCNRQKLSCGKSYQITMTKNKNTKDAKYTRHQVIRVARFCKVAAALSTGALLRNLKGIRLLGLLREKENAYLGSFFWTHRTLKVKSGGHMKL
jgi:hypothetical protein